MAVATAVVFVVDDDPSVRKSLTRVIAAAGYAVETFVSAREFQERAPVTGPCCLVLDVRMPGVTGMDLQKTLAQAVHQIPVVFITGHGDVAMSVAAMKAGAVDFLTKPFASRDLLGAIQRAVERDTRNLGTEARTEAIQARVKTLTPPERQGFTPGVAGTVDKQRRAALSMLGKTVKAHPAPRIG